MPLFYRGAGVGTYWHQNDARVLGFTPQAPGMSAGSATSVMSHIRYGTTSSPYISLTRSYGVAYDYAAYFGRFAPSSTNPAYVYEIELSDPLPPGLTLVDPIHVISHTAHRNSFPTLPYHHDGDASFLLSIVNPRLMASYGSRPIRQPPPHGATSRSPNMSEELETLVRALRDAEILAAGNIPATCVRVRHDVA